MVGREEIVGRRPDLAETWERADAAFPVRVTRSFWDRMADPNDHTDPLALQVLPDPRELVADPGDVADPVGDAMRSPVPWVVRKHHDRVLLLMTKRCHLYCRYCFRRDHEPGGTDPTPEAWERALGWILEARPREVILSGGDPLVLPIERVFDTIDRLRPIVRSIRIHTRAPITFPESVTPALVRGLRARAPVWLIVHCNHPRELSGEVDEALARLVDAGIPVLDQTVLLRGVNDDPDVLAELCELLVERRVHPYYLHVTDPVPGNAHLRVPLTEAIRLHDALAQRVGGTALPKLVVDPADGSGKVDARLRVG